MKYGLLARKDSITLNIGPNCLHPINSVRRRADKLHKKSSMSADARICTSDFTYPRAITRTSLTNSPQSIKAKKQSDELDLRSLISKTVSIIGKSSHSNERRTKGLLRPQLRSERLPYLIELKKGNPKSKWDNALPLICTPQALLHKACLNSSVRRKPLPPIKALRIQPLQPLLPPKPPQPTPDQSTNDPIHQTICMSLSELSHSADSPTIKDAEIKPPKIILRKKRRVSVDKSKDIPV
jgi:hypothetical protein